MQVDGTGQTRRDQGGRQFQPEDRTSAAKLETRATSVTSPRTSRATAEVKMGDTHHGFAQSVARAVARVPGNSADGVQRHLSDQHRRLRAFEGEPRQAAAQRFGLRLSSPKARSRSASVFAAASSACCTWRSSRNGCGASTTWTSSRRIRASFTRSRRPTARVTEVDNPAILPDPSHHRGNSRADGAKRSSSARTNTSAT